MDILNILITIACASIVLMFLVFIHEGGHFLASRAFGVRVSEFMIGFPGPGLKFKAGETRFGVTCVPLGGYARVCGMEAGMESPDLENVLASMYRRGTADVEDVAQDCGIDFDAARFALDELVEWGCVTSPQKTDEFNTYRVVESAKPSRRELKRLEAQYRANNAERVEPSDVVVVPPLPSGMAHTCVSEPWYPKRYCEGQARPELATDPHALYEEQRSVQYRSLPFWKRSVILVAGVAVNLLFAMVCFVIIYSVLGFDYQYTDTGEVVHITVDPLRAIVAGFTYIGMVIQAVVNLFNPATAADVVSDSTSIVGIAVLSKSAFEQGFTSVLSFMAMISVSLGIINLVPIPPLDGGRFVVEIIQKIIGRNVSVRVMNFVTIAGMTLFLLFFVVMLNQDIQRFVFGNW